MTHRSLSDDGNGAQQTCHILAGISEQDLNVPWSSLVVGRFALHLGDTGGTPLRATCTPTPDTQTRLYVQTRSAGRMDRRTPGVGTCVTHRRNIRGLCKNNSPPKAGVRTWVQFRTQITVATKKVAGNTGTSSHGKIDPGQGFPVRNLSAIHHGEGPLMTLGFLCAKRPL